jgi:GT2 family glycosyltransferase
VFLSPGHSKRTSIAIVNHNGGAGLRSMLVWLGVHDEMNAEVIVVDAASADGSPEMVRLEFPEVRVVRLPLNRGFAYSANRALEEIRGDVIVLCHHDLRARLTDLCVLADELRNHRHLRVAAAVPRIIAVDGNEQPIVGKLPGMSDYLWNAVSISPRRTCGPWSQPYLTNRQWCATVCGAFDAAVLRKLGGLDEHFTCFDFDADLCKRMHEATYLVWRCSTVGVVHAGRGPAEELPMNLVSAFRRDRQLYFQKHGFTRSRSRVGLDRKLRRSAGIAT